MNEARTPGIRIFQDEKHLAAAAADEFEQAVSRAFSWNRNLAVALSGGSTPALFFRFLARRKIEWSHVHLFWGDERCVPPDNIESNYLMTRKELLDRISIPGENIHRIRGEEPPGEEAVRYSEEIIKTVPATGRGLPGFDWILLGLGADGHTASIFPGFKMQPDPSTLCAIARHPVTGQERITLTLPVINNARRVSFLAAGSGKAETVASILEKKEGFFDFPAAHVIPVHGTLEWLLDEASGSALHRPAK